MFVRTNGLLEPACEQALHLGKRSEPRENARTCFTRSNRRACSKAILNQPASKLSIWEVARIHVRAARERRPECERRARGAGARSSPSRLASLNLNGELASRPSWPDIFRRPVVILSPLFCCYPYKIYGKRREVHSLEQITPQSEKSPQWPLCTITSDKQILPPRLVCVLNSLHPPSFCMGILFECTALGIHLYKTSRIYNVKTRLCSTDNAFRLFPSETLKTSRCFLLPNRITLRW